jgi:hypothetical protein
MSLYSMPGLSNLEETAWGCHGFSSSISFIVANGRVKAPSKQNLMPSWGSYGGTTRWHSHAGCEKTSMEMRRKTSLAKWFQQILRNLVYCVSSRLFWCVGNLCLPGHVNTDVLELVICSVSRVRLIKMVTSLCFWFKYFDYSFATHSFAFFV